MKIAIFGISRAGKDYFIENATRHMDSTLHFKGSENLRRLSLELLGKTFGDTTEEEKNTLRVAFTREVQNIEKQYDNIIVDGHYAFPIDGNEYRIVFTESDKMLYDVFLYLKPKTEQIIENQKKPKDGKPVRQFTQSEIENWEEFEIKEMQKICRELDKELIVLDGDFEPCADFLQKLISSPSMVKPRELVRKMLEGHRKPIEENEVIIVSDCDKTISVDDTGDLFCQSVGLDRKVFKEIFKGDYYSIYQFYKWKNVYKEYVSLGKFDEGRSFAISNIRMNDKLIKDISSKNVLTIGITTGLIEIWGEIKQNYSFPRILFGNQVEDSDLIISATTKRMLVEELQEMGKYVIALGDGTLDVPMLETADKAFIIAQEKLSCSVVRYFASNEIKVKQLSYSKEKYLNVEVVDSIWE